MQKVMGNDISNFYSNSIYSSHESPVEVVVVQLCVRVGISPAAADGRITRQLRHRDLVHSVSRVSFQFI